MPTKETSRLAPAQEASAVERYIPREWTTDPDFPLMSGCCVTVRVRGRIALDIPVRPSRNHHFSEEQRWELLLEYEKCLERGSKAEFCRRVGVTSGTVRDWARARDEGRLGPPGDATRALAPGGEERSRWMNSRERAELEHLRRENARLQAKLDRSEAAVEILGKASALLDAMAKSAAASDPKEEPLSPPLPEWLRPPASEDS